MDIQINGNTATQMGFESIGRWMELVLPGASRQMDIRVLDEDNKLLTEDPDEISLSVYDKSEEVIFQGTYPAASEIKKREAGAYYYELTAEPNTLQDYMLYWQVYIGKGYSTLEVFQYAKVAKVRALMMLPRLRNQIDKSMKNVRETHGWADDQLYLLLEGGVQEICKTNPRVNYTLATYPLDSWWQLLIDSATILGLISQGIFSIDTDLDYNDQGIQFAVAHEAKISGYLSTLLQRFNESIKLFGLRHYARPRILMQFPRRHFGHMVMVNAAPFGVHFPRIFGAR